jgi:hypothetical protein
MIINHYAARGQGEKMAGFVDIPDPSIREKNGIKNSEKHIGSIDQKGNLCFILNLFYV